MHDMLSCIIAYCQYCRADSCILHDPLTIENNQGQVVQSIVSLTSSLRGEISLLSVL